MEETKESDYAGTKIQKAVGSYSQSMRTVFGGTVLAAVTAWFLCSPIVGEVHRITIAVEPANLPGLFPVDLQSASLPLNCFAPYMVGASDPDAEKIPATLTFHADRICIDTTHIEPTPFTQTILVTVGCNWGAFTLTQQLEYSQIEPSMRHKSNHAVVSIGVKCKHGKCEPVRIFSRPRC